MLSPHIQNKHPPAQANARGPWGLETEDDLKPSNTFRELTIGNFLEATGVAETVKQRRTQPRSSRPKVSQGRLHLSTSTPPSLHTGQKDHSPANTIFPIP